jgi:hypothetical protein
MALPRHGTRDGYKGRDVIYSCVYKAKVRDFGYKQLLLHVSILEELSPFATGALPTLKLFTSQYLLSFC